MLKGSLKKPQTGWAKLHSREDTSSCSQEDLQLWDRQRDRRGINKNNPQTQETIKERYLYLCLETQERFTDIIKSETTPSHL